MLIENSGPGLGLPPSRACTQFKLKIISTVTYSYYLFHLRGLHVEISYSLGDLYLIQDRKAFKNSNITISIYMRKKSNYNT